MEIEDWENGRKAEKAFFRVPRDRWLNSTRNKKMSKTNTQRTGTGNVKHKKKKNIL